MSNLIYEVNVSNGEIVEREPTAEEMAQELADRERLAKQAKEKADAEAEAIAAKAALLEKLGITEEEARLLLS
jgi:hypothetical protein